MSTQRQYPVVPAPRFDVPAAEAARRAEAFADTMALRRTVRDFSARPVPPDVIEHAIRARLPGVAGRAGPAGHRLAQAVP